MTLKEVFESLNLTAYDLTVDMLDVHAVRREAYFQESYIIFVHKYKLYINAGPLQMRQFVCKLC